MTNQKEESLPEGKGWNKECGLSEEEFNLEQIVDQIKSSGTLDGIGILRRLLPAAPSNEGVEQAAKEWVEDRFNGGVSPTTESHCIAAYIAGSSHQSAGREVEFAEWANKSYTHVEGNRWDGDNDDTYTTAELYQLFLTKK